LVRVNWRSLVLVVVIGVCIGLFTGIVENRPSEIGIPEDKYHGFPLVWRITHTGLPDEYRFLELFVDCLFWFVIVLIIVLLVKKLVKS